MRLFVIEGCAGILVFHLDVSGISADSSLYPCVQNVLREIPAHRSQAVGGQSITLLTKTAAGGPDAYLF